MEGRERKEEDGKWKKGYEGKKERLGSSHTKS